MSRTIEIYLKGSATLVKVVYNGIEKIYSSNKPRSLEIYHEGVIIKADKDESVLNNFKIPLAQLVDKFGATSPTQLLEKIAENKFFKYGGGLGEGGVGSSITENEITVIAPSGKLGGYNHLDVIPIGTSHEAVLTKILGDGEDVTFNLPTGNVTSTIAGSLLYQIGQVLTMNLGITFNQNDGGPLISSQLRKDNANILNGNNYQLTISSIPQIIDALINYGAGSGSISNQVGEVFINDVQAGQIDTLNLSYSGVHPIYYGSVDAITSHQALLDSGIKLLNNGLQTSGTGDITIPFNNLVPKINWFMIPSNYPTKTVWYVDVENNGNIGSATDLINAPINTTLNTDLVNGVDYKLYIQNFSSELQTVIIKNN